MGLKREKKSKGNTQVVESRVFPMEKNHILIIIERRKKSKYFLHSTKILAPRNFTDHVDFLEQHGIAGDAALLTLAWACYGGIEYV